jgi:hypothetical protein
VSIEETKTKREGRSLLTRDFYLFFLPSVEWSKNRRNWTKGKIAAGIGQWVLIMEKEIEAG